MAIEHHVLKMFVIGVQGSFPLCCVVVMFSFQ